MTETVPSWYRTDPTYDLARRQELPARQIGRRWIVRKSLLNRANSASIRGGHVVATFGLEPDD
jgi:hypothetical protein